MPLPLVVDSIDTVPEAQRALYIEKDGKFALDVTGLEDTSGLRSALQKERDSAAAALRAQKELEKKFDGIDPAKIRDIMSKLDSSEEAKLIAEGKLDEVLTKRTEKYRAEIDKKVDAEKVATQAALDKAARFNNLVMDSHVRAAAAKAGMFPQAVDDALLRARSIFSLDDSGNAVQVSADGNVVIGKDGKMPYSPFEWIESMKEAAPHWFPAGNAGGGAQGGGASGQGKIMKRAAFEQLSAAQKVSTVKSGIQVVD